MMTLITGGSGSGKSAYAESYAAAVSGKDTKYYLATMQIFDEEGRRKVERHRRLRKGKGFLTVEQPYSIEEALHKMQAEQKTALLECMSNLTANEMFREGLREDAQQTSERIIIGIRELMKGTRRLVIVTNNVFEDGIVYDASTMEYLRALGRINRKLAQIADEVVEVVVGIPVTLKKEKK